MDIKNTKIWIGNNPELSIKVQKKLFELGAYWTKGIKDFRNKYGYALFCDNDLCLSYTSSNDKEFFNKHNYSEISIKQILGKNFKLIPVDKHLVVQDSCGNIVEIKNSYKEAEELTKNSSENMTIYKMVEVAKVTNVRIVKKVKVKPKKK